MGEGSVSVVPSNWMLDENTKCYWPKKVNRTLIIRRTIQQEWPTFLCTLIGQYETYEEAISEEKKAVASESENESHREGKRKLKTIRRFSPDISHNDKSNNNISESSSDYKRIDSSDSESTGGTFEPDKRMSPPPRLTESLKSSKENFAENSQIDADKTLVQDNAATFENLDNIPVTMVMTSQQFDLLMQHILDIKSTMKLILARVCLTADNNDAVNSAESIVEDGKIREFLPIAGLDKLTEFESFLTEDATAGNQLYNKVLLTGGKHAKEMVNRSLAIIYSEEVATMYSWTGKKNNFRIGDTKVISFIQKAVQKTYPGFTVKDFEMAVMNWFRFANERLKARLKRSVV